jgi:hypothetical protein
VIWPEKYDPKTSAIYALNDIDVKAPPQAKSAPDVASIKPGTLDDTRWLRPELFIWMKSAQGWVSVPDDVKALEQQ